MTKAEEAIKTACERWGIDIEETTDRMIEGKETIIAISDLERIYGYMIFYYKWFRDGYCKGDQCEHKKKISGCFYCELNRDMGNIRRGLNYLSKVLGKETV